MAAPGAAIPDLAEQQDRGIPQLNARRKGMPLAVKFIVGLAIIAALLGVIAMVTLRHLEGQWKASGEVEESADKKRARLPALEQPAPSADDELLPLPEAEVDPDIAAELATPSQPTTSGRPPQQQYAGEPTVPALTAEEQARADHQARRQRAPLMAYDAGMGAMAGPSSSPAPSEPGVAWPFPQQQAPAEPAANLKAQLEPTLLAGRSAGLVADPDMTVTQASILPCVLNTAIDSTVPGMVSCTLTANVYSTNGRVLLLERGSRVVGEYQNAALKQGMKRVFVLWTRVETPLGVVMSLDSPATDSLGRSGVTGRVNNHFWQRFGAGMLLSLVDDALSYAAQRNSERQEVQFSSTGQAGQDAASIAVENSVGIPPTLSVTPGAIVNIFVARDLYFGNVYGLRTAAR